MADIQNVQKLRSMYGEVTDTVAGIKGSIQQVQSQTDSLTSEKNAIEDAVMNEATARMTEYLDNTKILEFGPPGSVRVVYGGTYGDVAVASAIYDWEIQELTYESVSISAPPVPVWSAIYIYDGIGWDDDETIQKLVDDWLFAHDYLNQPLGTGGTYGINPNISSLEDAQVLLTNNMNKIKDSKAVFAAYLPPL